MLAMGLLHLLIRMQPGMSGHMQKSGIPVPLHIIVDRDSLTGNEKDPAGFVETEDYVELNGMTRYRGMHMSAAHGGCTHHRNKCV